METREIEKSVTVRTRFREKGMTTEGSRELSEVKDFFLTF
jgi:hypothetical protein